MFIIFLLKKKDLQYNTFVVDMCHDQIVLLMVDLYHLLYFFKNFSLEMLLNLKF